MGDFKRNSRRVGRFDGGGDDRPRRRFGSESHSSRPEGRSRRDDGPTEMHKVVCDKCGKKCTVPFKPTSSKPVYCNDCYRKNDNSFSKPGFEPRGRSEDLDKINQKLDKIIKALNIE